MILHVGGISLVPFVLGTVYAMMELTGLECVDVPPVGSDRFVIAATPPARRFLESSTLSAPLKASVCVKAVGLARCVQIAPLPPGGHNVLKCVVASRQLQVHMVVVIGTLAFVCVMLIRRTVIGEGRCVTSAKWDTLPRHASSNPLKAHNLCLCKSFLKLGDTMVCSYFTYRRKIRSLLLACSWRSFITHHCSRARPSDTTRRFSSPVVRFQLSAGCPTLRGNSI